MSGRIGKDADRAGGLRPEPLRVSAKGAHPLREGSPKERIGELVKYLDAMGDTCFVVGGRRIYTDDLRMVWKTAVSLACTVKRIYAEQLPDTWFVCGESTVKDRNGLPSHIHVCPAYGVDWTVIYERRDAQRIAAQSGETVKQGSTRKGKSPSRKGAPK